MAIEATIILAGGQSKRMKTKTSKVLHPLLGKPMIFYPLKWAEELGSRQIIIVVGKNGGEIKKVLQEKKVEFALQPAPRGTADAVACALSQIKNFSGSVLILYGDAPLFRLQTLKKLVSVHNKSRADLTILTTVMPDPSGYGRILRAGKQVVGIVEDKDASPEQKAICEVNAGVYCVRAEFLKAGLKKIQPDNQQKEYYLTDLVKIAVEEGRKVAHYQAPDWQETLGINSRKELAQATFILQMRINQQWMEKGVSIEAPQQVVIGPEVKIGQDTVIEAGARLLGNTRIGKNCWIQAGVRIIDSVIEDEVEIRQGSVIEESRIKSGATIGPMAHLRPGSVVGKRARIGNFVELKKAIVGDETKASHLTYLGDAVVGRNVNIGCGTITCNYDGERKHQTIIEDEVFVGSDTQFIAPVRVGKGAYIGSGSTITEDVPAHSLALARSRQVVKPGWTKAQKKKSSKK